jgi:CBS domain-containing protein
MRVQDVMNPQLSACRVDDTLQDAIRSMMDSKASVLPVVDRSRSLVGTISERDICMALHNEDARPAAVSVGDALNPRRASCRPHEAAEDALRTMRQLPVLSLPVTNADGRVLGIVDGNDLELAMRREAESLEADREQQGIPSPGAPALDDARLGGLR